MKDKIEEITGDPSKYISINPVMHPYLSENINEIIQDFEVKVPLEDESTISQAYCKGASFFVVNRCVVLRVHTKETGEIRKHEKAVYPQNSVRDIINSFMLELKMQILKIKDQNGNQYHRYGDFKIENVTELDIYVCDANIKLRFLTKMEELKMYEYRTIIDIKRYIAGKYKILPGDQVILFKGRELTSAKNLLILFLEENPPDNTLSMNLIAQGKRHPFIIHDQTEDKYDPKRDFQIFLKSSDTIAELKRKVQAKTGIQLKYIHISKGYHEREPIKQYPLNDEKSI